MSENDALQVIVVSWREPNGDSLPIPGDHDGAFGPGPINVGAQWRERSAALR